MKILFASIAAIGLSFSSGLSMALGCSNLQDWDQSAAYVGGDLIRESGVAYKAKWWNLNAKPSENFKDWEAWKIEGKCDDAKSSNPGSLNSFSSTGSSSGTTFSSSRINQACAGIPSWNRDEIYVGEDQVVFNENQLCTASWWTTGNTPADGLPWKCVPCEGSSSSSSSSSTGSSSTSSTSSNSSSGGPSGGKILAGYFTEWGIYDRNYHVKNLVTSGSAEKLTHILFAFGNVVGGQCVLGDSFGDTEKFYDAASSVDGAGNDWNTDGELRGIFGQFKKLKAMYPHLKILWSFGGWTWSGGFGEAAANPTAFAEQCYGLVNDPRWAGVFDGIDIDWEYPNECGLECDTSGFNSYRNLMQALRAKFGNQLVTSAIGAGESKILAADYGGASKYVDFYMLMTYDFFGAWESTGPTAPHSALYDYEGMPLQGFSTQNGIEVLLGQGVPPHKVLMGIGFYGRGWTGVTQSAPGGRATGPAQATYESGIDDYKVLKNTCPVTGQIAGTNYSHCGENWWSYDDPATISGKMNYVQMQGLGGAFFWETNGDTTDGELITAMKNGLQ